MEEKGISTMHTTLDTLARSGVYRTTVYIKADAQTIWDALTKSEWTERYGFEAPVEVDLKPGGTYRILTPQRLRNDARENGRELPETLVEGEVLAAYPPRRLVTTFQFTRDKELSQEGPGRLSYEIEGFGPEGHDVTAVTVSFEGPPGANLALLGANHAAGALGGLDWVTSDLKSVVETGQAFKESSRGAAAG